MCPAPRCDQAGSSIASSNAGTRSGTSSGRDFTACNVTAAPELPASARVRAEASSSPGAMPASTTASTPCQDAACNSLRSGLTAPRQRTAQNLTAGARTAMPAVRPSNVREKTKVSKDAGRVSRSGDERQPGRPHGSHRLIVASRPSRLAKPAIGRRRAARR